MNERTPLSRRQFLGAAALGTGLGALGLGRLASVVSADEVSGSLDTAGSAIQPAQRLGAVVAPVEPPPDGMLIFPVEASSDCYVLDNFGDCRGNGCSRLHEGIDIMGSRDQPLLAVARGRLTKRYEDRGLSYGAGHGWTLYDEVDDVTYKYFHMSRHEDGLEVGDEVQLGQVIGYVGNTGTSGVHSDSNYHLHFEVRPGNEPIDPLPLLVVDHDVCGVSPPIRG